MHARRSVAGRKAPMRSGGLPGALLCVAACASGPRTAPIEPSPHEERAMAAPDFCPHALDDLGFSGGELLECTPLMSDLYWVVATTMLKESVGAVVTRDGHAVTERGYAAGAAWLARIHVRDLVVERPLVLVQGLDSVGALPEGFTPAHLADKADPQGLSRLTLSPFRLELIADEPAPRRRAVLTGDADDRFTWTIERQDGLAWERVSVTPCQ